jgi:hypothetical protein
MEETRKLDDRGDWRVATQDDGRILVWVANDRRHPYPVLLTHGEATELLETLSRALGQPPVEEPFTKFKDFPAREGESFDDRHTRWKRAIGAA